MLIHQCDRCGSQHKDKSALTSVRIPLAVYRTGPRMAHVPDVSDKSEEMDICQTCADGFEKLVDWWLKTNGHSSPPDHRPEPKDGLLYALAALRELVRLKDIKERCEAMAADDLQNSACYVTMKSDYEYHRDGAWAHARRVVDGLKGVVT